MKCLIGTLIIGCAMLGSCNTYAQDQEIVKDVTLEPFVITVSSGFLGYTSDTLAFVHVISCYGLKPCECHPNNELAEETPILSKMQHGSVVKVPELHPVAKLYPNPTQEFTTLEFNVSGDYNVRIFDLTGKLIFNDRAIGINNRIDVSGFQPGMYVVNIRSSHQEEAITLKLIVK